MQDLRALAIFVKVAERRSFVRAATDLGITQSGVSNAISRLEKQVGTRLLARTTPRVSLTEHGAAYFERCRQDLTDHNCLAFTFRETRLAREWRFMQEGAEKGLTPKGNMSFSDGAAVCDAACAGYGLAQLQDYFADSAIAQGRLVSVLDRFKPN